MKEIYKALSRIFSKTKDDIQQFNGMLQPVIDQAQDEHERLYFHHILEEEEQRLERLDVLLPMLKNATEENMNPLQRIQLLQELNLEQFGLHNFREHLDLALFEFKDQERHSLLKTMRERTQADYLKVKDYLNELNQEFETSTSASELMTTSSHNESEKRNTLKKRLTVGSLR